MSLASRNGAEITVLSVNSERHVRKFTIKNLLRNLRKHVFLKRLPFLKTKTLAKNSRRTFECHESRFNAERSGTTHGIHQRTFLIPACHFDERGGKIFFKWGWSASIPVSTHVH